MITPFDDLGREIKVGSRIAYPVRGSCNVRLSYGDVSEIVQVYWAKRHWCELRVKKDSGRIVTVNRWDRCIVLGDK